MFLLITLKQPSTSALSFLFFSLPVIKLSLAKRQNLPAKLRTSLPEERGRVQITAAFWVGSPAASAPHRPICWARASFGNYNSNQKLSK